MLYPVDAIAIQANSAYQDAGFVRIWGVPFFSNTSGLLLLAPPSRMCWHWTLKLESRWLLQGVPNLENYHQPAAALHTAELT